MKKVIFILAFVVAGGLSLSAQCSKTTASDGKACCASKKVASSDAKQSTGTAIADAEQAAANNPNIQKRVCEKSGSVTYFEKSVCEESGSVTWNEVAYNATEKKFTRVASAGMERNPSTGEVKSTTTKKACCKGGDAKACSKDSKKACTAEKKDNN